MSSYGAATRGCPPRRPEEALLADNASEETLDSDPTVNGSKIGDAADVPIPVSDGEDDHGEAFRPRFGHLADDDVGLVEVDNTDDSVSAFVSTIFAHIPIPDSDSEAEEHGSHDKNFEIAADDEVHIALPSRSQPHSQSCANRVEKHVDEFSV